MKTFEGVLKIKAKGALYVTPTRDSKYLIIARNDTTITIYDLNLKNTLHVISFGKCNYHGIYHTKNYKFIILAGSDSTLKFVDYTTFTCVFTLKTQGEVALLQVSDDEKFIAYKVNQKTLNFYVITNPFDDTSIHTYGLQSNYHKFIKYFIDITGDKQHEYDPSMNQNIIMPYYITMMHVYSYLGLTANVKHSLSNESGLNHDSNGASSLELSLNMNHKNVVVVFIKYFTQKLQTHPFMANYLNLEILMKINKLGFMGLEELYDAILFRNQFSALPNCCDRSIRLPKYYIHESFIPNKNWFNLKQNKEHEMTIEFLTTSISLIWQ